MQQQIFTGCLLRAGHSAGGELGTSNDKTQVSAPRERVLRREGTDSVRGDEDKVCKTSAEMQDDNCVIQLPRLVLYFTILLVL